jgi:cyclopropane-fatty-acyl-phospholipid synthase
MGLDAWIVENYLNGELPVPGPVVQWMLDAYLRTYYRLEPLIGRQGWSPAQTEEIAARSRELMETHYNMPLAVFAGFLGPSMKYSMGLWEPGVSSLDDAQQRMLADVFAKADLRDGQRILDIGCGFGSFAAHALRRFPTAQVHGLTLSRTQADYLRARQGEAGHPLSSDRFHLIHDDFNLVAFDRPFDRIVSLGVFEHISNPGRALEKIRGFITREGRLFLHYIVYRVRPGGSDTPRQDHFMDRYVFPGGRIWAYPELAKHASWFRIEREWYMNGSHYRRTLQAWLANYRANIEAVRRAGGLSPRQLRLWEFYLRACIATFKVQGGNAFGNGQYLLRPV